MVCVSYEMTLVYKVKQFLHKLYEVKQSLHMLYEVKQSLHKLYKVKQSLHKPGQTSEGCRVDALKNVCTVGK